MFFEDPRKCKHFRDRGQKEFLEMGIPEEWIKPLFALGYDSIEKLKEVEKPGKLANDLNGFKVESA